MQLPLRQRIETFADDLHDLQADKAPAFRKCGFTFTAPFLGAKTQIVRPADFVDDKIQRDLLLAFIGLGRSQRLYGENTALGFLCRVVGRGIGAGEIRFRQLRGSFGRAVERPEFPCFSGNLRYILPLRRERNPLYPR